MKTYKFNRRINGSHNGGKAFSIWQGWRMGFPILLLALFLFWGSIAGSVFASTGNSYTIGILSFTTKEETLEKWGALETYLMEEISGVSFRVKPLYYPEMDEAVADGKIDFVFTNPAHYIALSKVNELPGPMATLIRYENGEPQSEFGGVIFTSADSESPHTLRDIRGKKVSAVDNDSLGGYQAAAFELIKAGLNPERDVEMIFTGMPHSRAVEAVLEGDAQVGFVRTGIIESMVEEGIIGEADLRILNPQYADTTPILSTELYPEWPFVPLPHVDSSISKQVAAALFSMEPDGSAAREIGVYGFEIPARYLVVEEMMRALRVPPFDEAPPIRAMDLWEQYREVIMAAMLLGSALFIYNALKIRAGKLAKKKNRELEILMAQLEATQEELREAKDEAVEASKVKSQFLANMSHEIRTPMNGIMGFLQLLEETPVSGKQADYIQHIKSSADLMMNLINDILDLSKIESGKMVLETIPFNLHAILEKAVHPLKNRAREKDLEMNLVIDPSLPPQVKGDPTRLWQIITNLVSNAVKFTETGSVSVTASAREDTDSDCKVEIQVQDTGIGIPQEALETLFDSFVQADDSNTRKFGGSGLGLAITRDLVDLMHGTITVTSEPGEGSCFIVTIPMIKDFSVLPENQKSEKTSKPEKTESILSQNGKKTEEATHRVLVVDDQKTNRILAVQMLENRGIFCDVAENGAEAVEACRRKEYQLVLMDVQMPVMDGLEATRQIRNLREHPQPRIIAMTAHAMKEDEEKCLAAGMDACLTKPVDFDNLNALLPEENEISTFHHLMKEGGIDEEAAAEILEIAIESWKEEASELEKKLAQNDLKAVANILHKVKGSAANLGINSLEHLAKEAEAFLEEEEKEGLRVAVEDMWKIVDGLERK